MSRSFCRWLPLISLTFLLAWPALARAEKRHPAEKAGTKSLEEKVKTSIRFENKSGQTVKVYWLDFEGKRKHYATVKDGAVWDQPTYLTHPWLITDENGDAWYVYYPDAQPRYIAINAPKEK